MRNPLCCPAAPSRPWTPHAPASRTTGVVRTCAPQAAPSRPWAPPAPIEPVLPGPPRRGRQCRRPPLWPGRAAKKGPREGPWPSLGKATRSASRTGSTTAKARRHGRCCRRRSGPYCSAGKREEGEKKRRKEEKKKEKLEIAIGLSPTCFRRDASRGRRTAGLCGPSCAPLPSPAARRSPPATPCRVRLLATCTQGVLMD